MVLGAGASELNVLYAISDPKEVEKIRAGLGLEEGKDPGAFDDALSSAFNKETGAQSVLAGRESIAKARETLKKVFERLGGGKS